MGNIIIAADGRGGCKYSQGADYTFTNWGGNKKKRVLMELYYELCNTQKKEKTHQNPSIS